MSKKYLKVHDGFFDDKLIDEAQGVVRSFNYNSNYNFIGNESVGIKYNWTFYDENQELKEIENKTFRTIWEKTKELLPVKEYILKRAYINVSRFGDEDRIHVDDGERNFGLTAILYLSGKWKITWGGQTNFYTKFKKGGHPPNDDETEYENEIIHSVIPKKNRIVIFNKNIPHAAGILSKTCLQNRYACVFKIITNEEVYE
jgi:hypothetical protein